MKRICTILALLLLLLLLLPLTGCAEKTVPTIRIGVALYQQDDTFISSVIQQLQIKAQAEEQARNIKINLSIADGQSSQATQNGQVDRFLERGCDVICVNIVDRTAAAVIVDKAKSAGVPVIFFNREPVREDLNRWEHAYYVGSQADRAGILQGELVLRAWRQDRPGIDRNGDGILQYVMLEGEAGHQDALLRTEYSIKTLTQNGVITEKLASQTADWQRGQAALRMGQWLREFGGSIEVVFANNDDMALGAIDAFEEAGVEELPFIVGVDATQAGLAAVEKGTLQGTVRNDASGQAKSLLTLSCALAAGETPAMELENGTYAWLEYTAVTRENLSQYLETDAS